MLQGVSLLQDTNASRRFTSTNSLFIMTSANCLVTANPPLLAIHNNRIRTVKLGQILIKRGWISPEQLERTLGFQHQDGGSLGTSLLEMGFITEATLIRVLSDQLGVPYATEEDLAGIAEDVVALLPREKAIQFTAVPFRGTSSRMDVAMLDIKNLTAQDELAFVSGRRVVPHIANEARIHDALETYYSHPCPVRYKFLLQRIAKRRAEEERGAAQGGHTAEVSSGGGSGMATVRTSDPTPAATVTPAVAASARSVPMLTVTGRAKSSPEPAPEAQPAAKPASLSIPLSEEQEAAIRGRGPGIALPDLPEGALVGAGAGVPEGGQPLTFEEAESRLAQAQDPPEVAYALLDYLQGEYDRVLLFRVLRNQVSGWMGRGTDIDTAKLSDFSVSLKAPSIFLNLSLGAKFYRGALPPMSSHDELVKIWGGAQPKEVTAVPFHVKGKAASFGYMENVDSEREGLDLDTLQRLADKVTIALEMCLMRIKLQKR